MASLDDERESESFSEMIANDEAFRAQLWSVAFGRRAAGVAPAGGASTGGARTHWMSAHRRRSEGRTPS
jgi:hypothetical protein